MAKIVTIRIEDDEQADRLVLNPHAFAWVPEIDAGILHKVVYDVIDMRPGRKLEIQRQADRSIKEQ